MSTSERELMNKWTAYVYRANRRSTRRLLEEYPERRHLTVDYGQLGVDYEFTKPLLSEPDWTFRVGQEALRQFAAEQGFEVNGDGFETLYLRLENLPETRRTPVADLRAEHIGELVSVAGTVAEVGPVRPKVVSAAFHCQLCDDVTQRIAQPGREFRAVPGCPSCRTVGFVAAAPERSEYVNAREVVLRSETGAGTVTVTLEHDLADAVSTGQQVRIAGIPRASRNGDSTVCDLYIDAVSVD